MAFVGRGINTVRTVGNQDVNGQKTFFGNVGDVILQNDGEDTVTDLQFNNNSGQRIGAVRANEGGYLEFFNFSYAKAPSSDVNGSIVTTVSKTKAQNGYFQFGNGLIVNWGVVDGGDGKVINFPKAFTTTNYSIVMTYNVNASGSNYGLAAKVKSKTTTNCTVYGDTKSLWIAAGY